VDAWRSPPACDRGVGMGGGGPTRRGVAQGGSLCWSCPGWGLGVG
jgi:hypothetical protein